MKATRTGLAALVLAAVLPLYAVAQSPVMSALEPVRITPEQRVRLAQKLAHIDAIVRAVQADRVNPPSAENLQWLRESLYGMSLESVAAIAPASDLQQVSSAVSQATKVREKVFGDVFQDLVYIPWAQGPCRYIDTRNVGGKITGARDFDTANSGATYGGNSGCAPKTLAGVTSEDQIAAYTLNITIVDTSGAAAPGFATMRPAGSANASALVNWTTSASGFQLGNAATVGSNVNGPNEIEIFTSGAVHAIVDLSGAFVPPNHTPLQCVVGTTVFSSPLTDTDTFNIQAGTCPTGYSLVANACAGTGSFLNIVIAGSGISTPAQSFCQGKYSGTGGATASNTPFCCRIPGR
jgi:hypothetical protein